MLSFKFIFDVTDKRTEANEAACSKRPRHGKDRDLCRSEVVPRIEMVDESVLKVR